jgi:hypothetical protein
MIWSLQVIRGMADMILAKLRIVHFGAPDYPATNPLSPTGIAFDICRKHDVRVALGRSATQSCSAPFSTLFECGDVTSQGI